ncbi:transformer-2 protein homolog beta-like [Monodelphis domestica]|uniref:transformer-2 protein homolog beta-like n=1 Tax=Monodelphis domestica TaxID=13616 RepID=UPI0024E1C237|nr:transformer-2 protein homolog beta-like [Monodelphis domestica]
MDLRNPRGALLQGHILRKIHNVPDPSQGPGFSLDRDPEEVPEGITLDHILPPALTIESSEGGIATVHSPMANRRRHVGNRANPDPNCCLGVFGLSLYTTERDLRELFSKYGPIADVSIVYDQQSRLSRGFAFVYFKNVADAKEAKERANGMKLDGRRIRVDFSITKRPHTPTPGIYMGKSRKREN